MKQALPVNEINMKVVLRLNIERLNKTFIEWFLGQNTFCLTL